MRKLFKNIFVCTAAAVLAAGGVAFSACKSGVKPLEGDDYKSTELAVSNGGFAVEYGKYVYFINGAATYEADNTFGKPVKGALMRITKEDLKNGKNNVQTVLPSLIVSSDTTAGFFIYNDRVYYATPNNVKNMSGDIDKDWLEFKSASLNGSDIKSYFRLSNNSAVFRFVQTEKNGTVYLMYNGQDPSDSDSKTGIRSYNTDTGALTTIVESPDAYLFNTSDKTDPYVYYTMSVKENIDTDAPITMSYNQVYRACADVTEETAPYSYTWNEEYLKKNKNVAPYVNLGTIVLDGVGKPSAGSDVTRFTHDYKDAQGTVIAEPIPPIGYSYTLQTYSNSQTSAGTAKGIYFTRKDLNQSTDTVGGGASLYYLSEKDIEAKDASGKSTWNSISGNKDKITYSSGGKLDVVAKPTEVGNAGASSLFYIDDSGKHHYIYVNGANMIRADVNSSTAEVEEQEIWYDASDATLVCLDNRATSADPYDYVWFTRTNGSGMSVERAVYNGAKENYETLGFGDRNNEPYKALKILDVQHKSSWYPYELIADMLLYADAESYGEASYDYIGAVSLTDKNGKYLNNEEFEKQVNDYWDFFMDSDKTVGYFAKLTADGSESLSNALTYYFKTGKTEVFYDNITASVDAGKKDNFLYTQDEQDAFKDFSEAKGDAKTAFDKSDLTGEFKDYNTKSSFVTPLGQVSDEDNEAMTTYWSGYLKNFTVEKQAEKGLKDWEIALAVVIPVLGVAGAGIATWLVLRNKKKKALASAKPERMRVDTTDDKSLDVYHSGQSEEENASSDGAVNKDEE